MTVQRNREGGNRDEGKNKRRSLDWLARSSLQGTSKVVERKKTLRRCNAETGFDISCDLTELK